MNNDFPENSKHASKWKILPRIILILVMLLYVAISFPNFYFYKNDSYNYLVKIVTVVTGYALIVALFYQFWILVRDKINLDRMIDKWRKINRFCNLIIKLFPLLFLLFLMSLIAIKFRGVIFKKVIVETKAIAGDPISNEQPKGKSISDNNTIPTELREYIDELKRNLTKEQRDKISKMAKKDLIFLHHGYGSYIRNKWFRGNKKPKLVGYFLEKGFNHPDDMSMELIRYLWMDLGKSKE